MPTITKEVVVDAPLNKIYSYVSKPSNLLQIWPGLIEMSSEKLLPNGGYSFRWMYKMFGIYLKGKGECVDIVPNLRLASMNTGSINSLITWTFRSNNLKTTITLTADYQVPSPILDRFSENILIKMGEKEAELILDNLRIIFEGR